VFNFLKISEARSRRCAQIAMWQKPQAFLVVVHEFRAARQPFKFFQTKPHRPKVI
jgi:hypothetical protein